MLNWRQSTKNTKGRVVLRGDIVKDDSESYAVFTEQGSSASQMTAAKIMDIISRLPGCAGQAADAVPAYTQVKMEDAPKLLKIQKSECPDIWILPRHKWPKSWSSIEDPVVPLERETRIRTMIERCNPLSAVTPSHSPSQQSRGMINVLNDVDRVPSNVQFSHQEALLYVFEDNEAVIKMIIKGRSPTCFQDPQSCA